MAHLVTCSSPATRVPNPADLSSLADVAAKISGAAGVWALSANARDS
jgi:hypothetical protein